MSGTQDFILKAIRCKGIRSGSKDLQFHLEASLERNENIKKQSDIQKGTLDPWFNYEFTLPVQENETFILKLLDKKKVIGEIHLPVRKYFNKPDFNGWIPWTKKSGKVLSETGSYLEVNIKCGQQQKFQQESQLWEYHRVSAAPPPQGFYPYPYPLQPTYPQHHPSFIIQQSNYTLPPNPAYNPYGSVHPIPSNISLPPPLLSYQQPPQNQPPPFSQNIQNQLPQNPPFSQDIRSSGNSDHSENPPDYFPTDIPLKKSSDEIKKSSDEIKKSSDQITKSSDQITKELLSKYEVDFSELYFDQKIGSGSFGDVFCANWRGSVVAVKKLQKNFSQNEENDFLKEALLMCNLRPHTNVVQFLAVTKQSEHNALCIVTEFMDHGALQSFLFSTHPLDTRILMSWTKGIAAGMLHLHSESIIHRDLASRNVLLGSGQRVKITDFGLARVSSGKSEVGKTQSSTGPLKWMPPEAIQYRIYSKKSDIWAFGVTLWEIIQRQEPYGELDPVQVAIEVLKPTPLRLKIPDATPPVLREIMECCFHTDPEKRKEFDWIVSRLNSASSQEWQFQVHHNNSPRSHPKTQSPNHQTQNQMFTPTLFQSSSPIVQVSPPPPQSKTLGRNQNLPPPNRNDFGWNSHH